MAFNTGLQWAHSSGLVDSGATYYGANGQMLTKASFDADYSANKVAVIDTNGAIGLMIKPMVYLQATSSGVNDDDDPFLHIYGVLGVGETSSPGYAENPKFLWNLGKIQIGAINNGAVSSTASTSSVMSGPDGLEYASHNNVSGTNVHNGLFSQAVSLNSITSPGSDNTSVNLSDIDYNDTNVSFCLVPGINMFQQIYITFELGEADATSRALPLVNLIY